MKRRYGPLFVSFVCTLVVGIFFRSPGVSLRYAIGLRVIAIVAMIAFIGMIEVLRLYLLMRKERRP